MRCARQAVVLAYIANWAGRDVTNETLIITALTPEESAMMDRLCALSPCGDTYVCSWLLDVTCRPYKVPVCRNDWGRQCLWPFRP